MKFRTDFVTNSSDSSFLTFNIKNKKLFQALEKLGIQLELSENGEFTDFSTITLPSGEEMSIEGGENWFYPYPSDFDSISAWLVACILWEVEDIYPQKGEDDYSDVAKELIGILNNSNITDLDWEMVNEWSREDLYQALGTAFDDCDSDLEEAYIEYNYGFEGEVSANEVVEVKNGMMTTYSYSEYDEDRANIEDLKFVLVGKFQNFETREEFKEFIEDLGGVVSSSVSKNTHFVICNDDTVTSKTIDKAKELCIPIITERAFIAMFADPEEFDEFSDDDELDEDLLWETTYDGGFKDIVCEYGLGNVMMQVWKKGKWVIK